MQYRSGVGDVARTNQASVNIVKNFLTVLT
jgi:hypothetical protein